MIAGVCIKALVITTIAQMAELVDASDSKSGFRKEVQVRFLFWAQKSLVIIDCKTFFVPAIHTSAIFVIVRLLKKEIPEHAKSLNILGRNSQHFS